MIKLLPEWRVNPVVTSTPSAADLYAENFQKGTELMAEERWQEAVEAFLEAIESDPENDRIHLAHNGLGLAYDQLGQLDLAINHFDQAITLAPNFADGYANRADVWRALGDVEKAFADYDQAIELDPNIPRYYYNRAITYKWQGELEKAITDYDQAIALDPEFAYAYHNRANIYWMLGDLTQALADFDNALQYDPTDKLGYQNRGRLYLDLNDLDAAHADFSQVISLCDPIAFSVNDGDAFSRSFDNNCTYAYLYRAEIEYQTGAYEASLVDLEVGISDNADLAMDYFEYLVASNPHSGYPYFGRGLVLSYLGDEEGALADYSEAIQKSGTDPMRQNYYLSRGILFAVQGDLDAAIADWQQTVFIEPNHADAHFNLGMAYQEQGNYEAAVNSLLINLAQDIPPDYQLDTAMRVLWNAENLLFLSENVEQTSLALTAFLYVDEHVSELMIPAGSWNNLCWFGSLWGLAEDVIFACETAVKMDPEQGAYRDSRGLARALTGDLAGAIEDFNAYVLWQKENENNLEVIDLRKGWMDDLEAGEQPFDAVLLEQLRNE